MWYPKARDFHSAPSLGARPPRSPGYSPVLGGKRHPGAREGCAAQAAGRAVLRWRRCLSRGTGAWGHRGGDSGGGGAGSCGLGGLWIRSCRAVRALCPSPAPLKWLLLLPLEGRESRGRGGGTRLGGREGKRGGWGRARGEGEMITRSGEEEGREARTSSAKVPTRRARGGEMHDEEMGHSPAPHLPSAPSPFAPFPWALPRPAQAGGYPGSAGAEASARW